MYSAEVEIPTGKLARNRERIAWRRDTIAPYVQMPIRDGSDALQYRVASNPVTCIDLCRVIGSAILCLDLERPAELTWLMARVL